MLAEYRGRQLPGQICRIRLRNRLRKAVWWHTDAADGRTEGSNGLDRARNRIVRRSLGRSESDVSAQRTAELPTWEPLTDVDAESERNKFRDIANENLRQSPVRVSLKLSSLIPIS